MIDVACAAMRTAGKYVINLGNSVVGVGKEEMASRCQSMPMNGVLDAP